MLTKSDLNQIRGVVHEEVDVIMEEKLEKKLKPIKKDLRYLKKTVDLTVKNYDEGDVRLERRVKKIEAHIGLTS
ncbi:MAG: hypothetical protein A3D74_02470 [Candidatus Levybacteria bacterium RIFCSPHIGHO2_02_FULL_37_13]|nr:MAG: hypothetical protein A3D74_02470 [Candidatus Levybacteria bacterium RIFCSPHIGHO2_02_FULL_37_13]OGH30416.1 MAG: hypothetical protein A3E40_01370 [Candidatus Levybacteria bacterium RIFCSPHIGHO2_12_FULL_37_9]